MLPYLYSSVHECVATGMPIMRALWLHYPEDPKAVACSDKYLWGKNMLVAPVIEKGATTRRGYLPRGDWYDFWTNGRIEGGREVIRNVDLGTMPLFVRAGSILQPDALSGDDGPNLFGHAWNTATYVVHHPEFGWLAFGGNTLVDGAVVKVKPLDSFRMRVYVAANGVWLTLDAGKFEEIEVNSRTGSIRVGFSLPTEYLRTARLRIEQPAKMIPAVSYRPAKPVKQERGAYVIPLGKVITWVDLTPIRNP
jgi:hypothetical protein